MPTIRIRDADNELLGSMGKKIIEELARRNAREFHELVELILAEHLFSEGKRDDDEERIV